MTAQESVTVLVPVEDVDAVKFETVVRTRQALGDTQDGPPTTSARAAWWIMVLLELRDRLVQLEHPPVDGAVRLTDDPEALRAIAVEMRNSWQGELDRATLPGDADLARARLAVAGRLLEQLGEVSA